MTIANDIIFLSLRNSGVNGIGQTPMPDDVNDAFKVMNAWINELNLERRVAGNTIILPTFSDLVTDVSFWTPYEHVLLTSMSVRLRQIYALPPVDIDVMLAQSALAAFSAINLQQISAPDIDPFTPLSLIYMALRAAGRINDKQGVSPASQDVSEAHLLAVEMCDEWTRERAVRVIPGNLPDLRDLNAPLPTLEHGHRNAIVLNLAVRLRDLWGQEVPKTLQDRADRALQLIQAINMQQIAPIVPGTPTTVRQMVVLALRLAGRINDTQRVSDTSADMNDAMSLMAMMIAQWQRKRWLIWNEAEVSKVSTGNQWYSIGPGLDFNTARPDRIHAAWCRMKPFAGPMAVDLQLQIIESKEDWATLTIKDLKSIPSALFYDSAFPQARVTFWPMPPAGDYELHIVVKAQLPVLGSLDTAVLVPPEYTDAIVSNLALRMIVASPGSRASPELLGQARSSLSTIRLANSQIPQLGLPAILGGIGGDVSSWVGKGLNHAWTTGGTCVLS
jgi:hypothetical protein